MSRPYEFPPAGWEDEVVGRRVSSESDFFAEFFGTVSPPVSAEFIAAGVAAALGEAGGDAEALGQMAGEDEAESPARQLAVEKEAAGGSSHHHLHHHHHHPKRKRNRTTEMHNMTERKRRDKIKGRLKALQELIPNSHKLDRASLLDETIAYVKTLQMEVQYYKSNGSNIYHPPCMPPSPSPCLLPNSPGACLHMPFSPFSRVGMGYGMGMASVGFPLVPAASPHPPTNFVQIPGFGTIPSLCPHSQVVPFPPAPEFVAAMTPSIPSPPTLQSGPFSSRRAEGSDQEAVTTQLLQIPNVLEPVSTTC